LDYDCDRETDEVIDKNMNWSKWARQQKGSKTQLQMCAQWNISEGCFTRMTIDNKQPNQKNLERIAKAEKLTVWELMREVYEIDYQLESGDLVA
jgi:hypothetical protein